MYGCPTHTHSRIKTRVSKDGGRARTYDVFWIEQTPLNVRVVQFGRHVRGERLPEHLHVLVQIPLVARAVVRERPVEIVAPQAVVPVLLRRPPTQVRDDPLPERAEEGVVGAEGVGGHAGPETLLMQEVDGEVLPEAVEDGLVLGELLYEGRGHVWGLRVQDFGSPCVQAYEGGVCLLDPAWAATLVPQHMRQLAE